MTGRKFFSAIVITLASVVLFGAMDSSTGTVQAVSGSDWKAGRIIDDPLFVDGDAMSVAQIQAFLDAKVGTGGYDSQPGSCDSNGARSAQPYSSSTRAQYAASLGRPTKFTCLNNYYEVPKTSPGPGIPANNYGGKAIPAGAKSAAQLIWDAAKKYSISPKVLLVTIQKESAGPLTTDDWPFEKQYTYAMGAHCPDSGPGGSANCDPDYAGFSIQISESAALFRYYLDNMDKSWWPYKKLGNNSVLYNPNTSCGSSTINIQTKATAALYTYTPYQPNAAALNNLYGTGDGCSAYGNRNFWRIYHDWFGAPIDDAFLWEVVHNTDNGRLYLAVNGKRHYIPTPELLAAWGLDDYAYRDVTTNYINQLTSGPNIQSVALDVHGTRYLMSQGKKYKLKSDAYVLAWGVAGMQHISAPGLLAQTASGGDAGRFAKTPDGTIYLVNNYRKHLPLNPDSFSHWGITSSNTTSVLVSDIAHMPLGNPVGQFVSFQGVSKIIDRSKRLEFKNSNIQHGWSTQNFVGAHPFASNILTKVTFGSFVSPVSNGKVYFVEGGKRHYVTSPSMTRLWNMGSSNPLVTISDALFDKLTPSENLKAIVKSSSTGKYYLMADKRYEISGNSLATVLTGDADAIPSHSSESLNLLSSGGTISSPLAKFSNSPHVYTFDGGVLRRIANPDALDAFGAYRNNPVVNYSGDLFNLYDTQGSVGFVLNGSSGNSYYLEKGYKHKLDADHSATWRANSAATVSDELLAQLTNSGQTLKSAIKYAGKRYIVNNGSLIDATSNYDIYGLSDSSFKDVTRRYMKVVAYDGFFVQPMNSPRVYVLSYGKLYHVSNPQVLSDLGYGRLSGLLSLHPDIIEHTLAIQDNKASRLVKTPTSGILFTSLTKGYGFGDLSTLIEYKGNESYVVIPSRFFNKFTYSGQTSKLVNGTNGKIYAVDDNTKRWVTSQSALQNNYPNTPVVKLPQSTIDGFSTGPNITN